MPRLVRWEASRRFAGTDSQRSTGIKHEGDNARRASGKPSNRSDGEELEGDKEAAQRGLLIKAMTGPVANRPGFSELCQWLLFP